MGDYDTEDAESWPVEDLLDDVAFAHKLASRCQTLRDRAALELEPSSGPLRLRPGEAIEAVVLPGPVLRVCCHEWHGSRLLCTELTSALVLPNRPCPVCAAKRNLADETWADDFRIHARTRVYLPCAAQAKRLQEGGWQVWKTRFAALLEVDEDFVWTWSLGNLASGHTYCIERCILPMGQWGWEIAPVAGAELTKHELRVLRSAMPGVLVLDPREKEVADLVETAKANWLNAPLRGRAQPLMDALPGVLLVPCYFAVKRTKVRWAEGFWSHESLEDYGIERLDKGNIAALLGPPSDGLCSIDWDTDRFDIEFRRRNPWACSCMRSWASRPPGNYWFRIRGLPEEVSHVHKLKQGGNDIGELRLGHCITVLSGAHPSGAEYRIQNLGAVPEITLDQITWPHGVMAVRGTSARSTVDRVDWDALGEGQPSIELAQVEGLRPHPRVPGALHGRCPVCARENRDRSAEHLMIYASGCWTTRGTCQHEHAEIYALIGLRNRRKSRTGRTRLWRGFTRI